MISYYLCCLYILPNVNVFFINVKCILTNFLKIMYFEQYEPWCASFLWVNFCPGCFFPNPVHLNSLCGLLFWLWLLMCGPPFLCFFLFSLSVFSVEFIRPSHFFLSLPVWKFRFQETDVWCFVFPHVCSEATERQESEADGGQMPLLLIMKVLENVTLRLLSLN